MHRLPIRDWTAEADDPALVFARLTRATGLMIADWQPRFDDAGLPSFDLARLLWLWSAHDIALDVRVVGNRLGISRSAASRLVDRGTRAGLLERRPGVLDARDSTVRVTLRGRSVIHRLDAVVRSAVRGIGLDDPELAQLGALVEKIARRYARS